MSSLLHSSPIQHVYDPAGNLLSWQSISPAKPTFTSQPAPLFTAGTGETASFSINAASALPLTYQWYFNGTLISGAIGDSLLLSNVTAANEGNYTVTVTNSLGSVTSNPGRLAIDTNGNLLGDTWEMTYFGNLLQTAPGDFDGDGVSNIDEYNQGLNPAVREIVYWIAASGDFNNPANWSRSRLPIAGDTAVINSGTFTLPASGSIGASQVTVNVPYTAPAATNVTLNITGKWSFNSAFTLASGRLFTVNGAGGEVTVTGTTNLNAASITASGGAKVTFSNLPTFTHPANISIEWTAYKLGSELNFANLTTINGPATPGEYLSIVSDNPSKVNLPALTTITKASDGDTTSNSGVILSSTGGGLLTAPVLTTFNDNDPYPDSRLVSGTATTLSAPLLLAPTGTSIDLSEQSDPKRFTSLVNARTIKFNSGSGNPLVSNLTAVTGNTTLHLTGGAIVSFPSLTSVANLTSILVDAASKASFGGVTSYSHPATLGLDVSWTSRTAGSELSFPILTTINGPSTPGEYLSILAEQGGKVSLPALTTITKPTDGDTAANSGVILSATTASQLTAPLLSGFNDNDPFPDSRLVSDATSTLSAPLLLAPRGTSIDLNELSDPRRFTSLVNARAIKFNSGGGTPLVSNLASITGNTSLHVTNGVNITFANLTSLESLTSILVDDASKASFNAVTSYTHPAALNLNVSWTTRYAGSELSFPNLATINGPSTPSEYLSILAEQGGKTNFAALTTITKPTDGDSTANSGVILSATTASQIAAPLLSGFDDNDSFPNSRLTSDTTSTLFAPLLLAPIGASIDLNELSDPRRFTSLTNARTVKFNSGSGVALVSNLASVTGNTTFHLTSGANVTFSSLSSISSLTSILVDNTAKATFNAVTSYTQPSDIGVTWTADDAGSILNFTNLASIIGPATSGEYLQITGRYGGRVLLPALTTLTKAGDADTSPNSGIILWAYGGGTISAPLLTTFQDVDSRPDSELKRDTTSFLNLASLRQENLQGVLLTGVTLLTGPPVIQLPVINSAAAVTGYVGNTFTYQISATNTPFFFNATPLPPGLTLNSMTGLISGEPSAAGVYNLTLRAINLDGETTKALTLTVTPPGSVVSPTGLYSWWKGDIDGRDAIGGQHGTLQGGSTIQTGRVGNAFSFSGTNQTVVVPQSPSLDLSRLPAWTIEAWIYPTSFTGSSYPTIYAQGAFGASFGLDNPTGKLQSWVNDSNNLLTTASVVLNRWSHVAMSYNGTNRVFYINGVNAGSGATPAITDINAGASIGNVNSSASNSQFFGKIDELAVYGRALADAEITAIHAAGISGKTLPPATPPVILTQPVAATVREGIAVSLSVVAIGPAPLTYQWLKNSNPLSGKTAATLEFPATQLSDAGQYSVVVTSPGGPTASQSVALVITPDPSILLTNNVPVSGLAEGVANGIKLFHLIVPSGQSQLVIRLTGGTGNANLYVRRVTDPTTAVYDFRSIGNTNQETLTITNPVAGDWRFMVNAASPYSNLTITANYVPPTFQEYLANAGVPVAKRGPMDDPDYDGISNLIEFALGMAPMTAATSGLPQAQVSGGSLTFTYSKAREDLIYTVETATTLETNAWTSAGVNQGTTDSNNRVTASIPMGSSKRFLRLSVRTNP